MESVSWSACECTGRYKCCTCCGINELSRWSPLSSDQWERNFFKVVCSFLLCPLATRLATGPPWLCGVVPVVTAAKVCADCWPDHLLLYSQLVAWSRFWARVAVHSKQLWREKDKKWTSQASTCTIKYLACHRFIIGVQQNWNIKLHVDFQFFLGFFPDVEWPNCGKFHPKWNLCMFCWFSQVSEEQLGLHGLA